ncbi:MAG TPA: class I SAM-dependent methyltransferase [Gaiellaceae bacterium]|jgi:ubiquinone/menaquinone biosynthesis C-methylase UbiE
MNENHALCATSEWAEFMEQEVLEPVTAGVDLGAEMLEIGPGPGAATRWLRHRVDRLVALELDEESGTRLAGELAGTNVTVEIGDSTSIPFPDESFDSVACFTMLHHVPTQQEQFATLREAFRVLRRGGVLVGADSLASQGLHEFHEGDTYNPIDPARLLIFLQAAGFGHVMVSAGRGLLFTARKPSEEDTSGAWHRTCPERSRECQA